MAVKGGSRPQSDPADRAGSQTVGASHDRARTAKTFPARMVSLQTGASGYSRPLQKGESGRQTCPSRPRVIQGSQWPQGHYTTTGGSTAYRRAMGEGQAASAAAEVHWRTTLPRSPDHTRRHPVGGTYRIIVAGDAEGIRQMGECLPTIRTVDKPGPVATNPRSSWRRGTAWTSYQGT